MKSKIRFTVFLYLLVTLLFIPISNAEEITNPSQSGKEARDNLILTEDMSDDTNSGEDDLNTISTKNNEGINENKESNGPVYIDRKEAEINDRINSAKKSEENTPSEINMVPLESSFPTATESDYSDEEFENIIDNVTLDYNFNTKDYENAMTSVSEVLASSNISKEESQKITDETNKIIDEYNQKIEAAETLAEKEALEKEAASKINQNIIENVSILSSDTKSTNIDSQKNEKLRIEVSPAGDNDENLKKDGSKKVFIGSFLRSPKLSQGRTRFFDGPVFIIAIIILLTLSASFSIAIRKKEK